MIEATSKSPVIVNKIHDIIPKEREVYSHRISKHNTKIDNNTNNTENEVNVVFENIRSNFIDISCSEETKDIQDSIFYNDSQNFIDIISICDSEKIVFDSDNLEDYPNTPYIDNKCNISTQNSIIIVNTDSEEIIDVIN
jgi:hypothetical protein